MIDKAPISHPVSWPVRTLGNLSEKIGSGATPTGGEANYLSQRIRWALVRSQNVFDRRFEENGLAYISDEQAENLSGVSLQSGDILLNITGDGVTFGRACIVPDHILPAVVNQHVSIIRVNPQLAEPGYVLAYLTHPDIKHYIESFNAGGSRRAITKGHIESFRVPIPPLSKQRAIAHILGTLDDKIELNRRMNETLEAIARAIFQSWFVDFDPVRAKASGEPTDSICRRLGLTPDLLALFPDSFQESELGEVPEGWEVGSILERAKLLSGGTPKTKQGEYWNGDILWASAKDVSQCADVFLVQTERTITRKGLEESSTQLIPAFCTVVVARGATTGRMVMLSHKMAMNQTCYALSSFEETHYALHYLLRHAMETLVHTAHGSVFDTITTKTFEASRLILPTILLMKAFDAILEPLLHRILANIEEIQLLATLRDTLLPKLLSGELRVKEADSLLAKAT